MGSLAGFAGFDAGVEGTCRVDESIQKNSNLLVHASKASTTLYSEKGIHGRIGYLSDLVVVPSRLLQADVVKPGIIVERVLLHLPLILEAPLIHHHILPLPTGDFSKTLLKTVFNSTWSPGAP